MILKFLTNIQVINTSSSPNMKTTQRKHTFKNIRNQDLVKDQPLDQAHTKIHAYL